MRPGAQGNQLIRENSNQMLPSDQNLMAPKLINQVQGLQKTDEQAAKISQNLQQKFQIVMGFKECEDDQKLFLHKF